MQQFFNTLIEGSIIGFNNVRKEYIQHRRIIADKISDIHDKKDLLVLIQDFDKRYDHVIKTTKNMLIESLEIEEDRLNLSMDILLQTNKEFYNFYHTLKRIILKRCIDPAIQTNVNDEQKVFAYLKYVSELYKTNGDISDEEFVQNIQKCTEDVEKKHILEFKKINAIDQAFSEWQIDFDYAVTWAEKWRVKHIGELVENFYQLIENDHAKI